MLVLRWLGSAHTHQRQICLIADFIVIVAHSISWGHSIIACDTLEGCELYSGECRRSSVVPLFGTLAFFWRRAAENGGNDFSFFDVSPYSYPAVPAVEHVWNVMAHAQKPYFVFRPKGRVHLNRRGRQFSGLLAAEVCASALLMQDTACSEVDWKTTGYPLHSPVFPSLPLPYVTVCHQVSTELYVTRILSYISLVYLPLMLSRYMYRVAEESPHLHLHYNVDVCVVLGSSTHSKPAEWWALRAFPVLRSTSRTALLPGCYYKRAKPFIPSSGDLFISWQLSAAVPMHRRRQRWTAMPVIRDAHRRVRWNHR